MIMKRTIFILLAVVMAFKYPNAQPEYYSDAFLGLPEFHARIVRLPALHPDSVAVEVHVRIVYDDLQFVKIEDVYRAEYTLDVILRDKKDKLRGYQHFTRSVKVDVYNKTNSRQFGDLTTATFTLIPENYNLKILLTDEETHKDRVLEKKIDFPDNQWGKDLQLGELIQVDSTGSALMTTGLLRGEPLRIQYRLRCTDTDNLVLFFQLVDENDQIIQKKGINIPASVSYYTDRISISTESLANQSYAFIMTARLGNTAITRNYQFKILWEGLPDYVQDIQVAIRQLKYVATDEEYDQLMNAPPSRREAYFNQFWKKKDPTPSTAVNEKMEEYYRRVRFANEHFQGHGEGWLSDMGEIYIIFGAPTDIERHPFTAGTKPYEIWYYYDLNRQFIFVDNEGFGVYRLESPFWD